MNKVQFLAGRDSEWSNRFRQVRPAALCRGETAENRRLKGVELKKDKMKCQMKEETELTVKKNW